MPTLSEVRRHKQAVADLVTLALRDLRGLWGGLGSDDPRRIASDVREFAPLLTETYSLASSTLAADWYDDLRAEVDAGPAYAASVLDAPSVDEVQDRLGFTLAPLFSDRISVDPDRAAVASRLASLVEEVVTTSDRQTVRSNMAVDRSAPRYARHASANACAFCALLATKGADYRSEESASRVVLARTRNKRSRGEKYHDNCRCTVVPVWDRGGYEEAPYVADWRGAYDSAVAEVGGASDTKAILAHMRQQLGTN